MLTGTAAISSACLVPSIATAQELKAPESDGKLLLAADDLVYNRDLNKVTAVGAVQINYAGYKLVAQKVEYDQKSGRLTATGNIELVEPSGNRVYADAMDVTDTFADGFVNSLRIETPDNTRLVAESAERVGDRDMILHNGVYTACLPCAENPEKPPLWQVKAQKVIQNGETHTIRLENARFEFLGLPLVYLPFIEVPDHTVKRKSGFLFPTMRLNENVGFGVTVPYYYVISGSMDATLSPTYFSEQGLLLEGEFRQRFETGSHTLRFAGIDQRDPGTFTANTSDALEDKRGMVQSVGAFRINPRWTFGWDVMLQSDNNFSHTYDITGANGSVHTNTAYLTGLGRRNYFDLRAFYFDVQDADPASKREDRQAKVFPTLDYDYTAPQPIAGGELTVKTNLTHISRTLDDTVENGSFDRFRGLPGEYTRLTSEAVWQRTLTVPGGLLLTPILSARADGINVDMTSPNAIDPARFGYAGDFHNNDTLARGMVTAGLEARYPILISTASSSHIIEPIGQIFVRPDEQYAGGLPNEDAQSFVFDGTNLFERDKFSGFDRMEGGTRANLGIRYTGSFDNGWGLNGVFGQSYHLAGLNSFATEDLVNAGADSGLEEDVSDFVTMFGVETPFGISLTGNMRLDKDDFSPERTGATLAYSGDFLTSSVTYTHISSQPIYADSTSTDEVQGSATVAINDNWSVFGSAAWDMNNNIVSKRTAGFSYTNECLVFTLLYSDDRDVSNTSGVDRKIGARLTFRTLGDINIGG
nr:LPS-assembly protein LptD [Gellertiella hungarica]